MEQNNRIPENEKGVAKDFKKQVVMETAEDAEELFLIARHRLLNVNDWKNNIEGNSADFQLHDAKAKPLNREAQKGDFLAISIPGPGTTAGKGNDWVHIEEIMYDDYPDDNGECISLQLRPCPSPANADEHTAHFFNEAATSTIQVKRWGKMVTAYYHGRNETPNTDTGNIADTLRNVTVATSAVLGFSAVQWNNLLESLIKIPGE